MRTSRSWQQAELFGAVDSPAPTKPMPADFVERIRSELTETLAMALGATELPWIDLTAATLAELRFNSVAGWLPLAEANVLRERFQREMTRLYALAENRAE